MAKTTGRPRSEAAHQAILKAALQLVTNRGFRPVTVNDIAAEAGVGKMTLYRHWPNKAALVMDALLVFIGNQTAFPEAGSALESLRRQLDLQAAFFQSQNGTLIRSLIAEAQSDPELAIAFRERWLKPRRDGVRQTILAAIAEGSIRKDIDLDAAIDLLYGPFYYRLLLGAGTLDARFVEDVYAQFLKGHQASETSRTRKWVRK